MGLEKQGYLLSDNDRAILRHIVREVLGETPQGARIPDEKTVSYGRFRYYLLKESPTTPGPVEAKQANFDATPKEGAADFNLENWGESGVLNGEGIDSHGVCIWLQGKWVPITFQGGKMSFRLLTDASGGEAQAELLTLDGLTVVKDRVTLKYKWGILDDARAGYVGDCTPFGGDYYFDQGPCIVKCFTDASISSGSFPDGEVDAVYEHTVTVSDAVEGSIEATGLPDGLTIDPDTGIISGTPTESGDFFVIITASGLKTGPGTVIEGSTCVVTEGFDLTIVEPPPEEP